MPEEEFSKENMSDLSRQEAMALEKFRPLAVPLCEYEEQASDENLLKWLRARDFNVRAAEEMLKKVRQLRVLFYAFYWDVIFVM
ncbi:unnamed protein product [Allacma fusca]|uniref:CRAL/TRIO N-terminal domain-containing protein n=2 Tax=Allacma fusca TaxID=39272 RepID=A0A8J2KL32_9HEXA|nr:unnamed protein product [Allacma fusca]